MKKLSNANTLVVLQLSTLLLLSIWLNMHLATSASQRQYSRLEGSGGQHHHCVSSKDRLAHLRYHRFEKFHVCLRTRDSGQVLDELLLYYFYHGVTSMSVYDDGEDSLTEDVVRRLIGAGFDIEYKDVRRKGEKARLNENMDLLGCFLDHFKDSTYIMNVDDDEFFFPTDSVDPSLRIIDFLRESDAACLAMPIFMFGTGGIESMKATDTTIETFVYRDKDITNADYRIAADHDKEKNRTTPSKVWYMYKFEEHRHTTWKRRRRIQKAVYLVKNVKDKKEYIQELMTTFKTGSLIHGYGMDCRVEEEPPLAVAHYTRARKDLISRVDGFWNTTVGLRRRFQTRDMQVAYMQERDRNSQRDDRLVKYGHCLRMYRAANGV